MNKVEGEALEKTLLTYEPQQLQEWLNGVIEGRRDAPDEVNWWLGVAEMVELRAYLHKDIAWAKVAIALFEHLAYRIGPAHQESFLDLAQHLNLHVVQKDQEHLPHP